MATATLVRSAVIRFKDSARPYPTLFSLPGIKQKPWWTVDELIKQGEFNWVHELQEKVNVIQSEYINLMKHKPQSDYEMQQDEHKLHSGEWKWHSFILKGNWQTDIESYCPETSKILKSIPGLMTDVPFSYCFFSNLKACSSIDAHYAPCNLRVR